MSCENTKAHEPHSYEQGFGTVRRCPGIEKLEHFCGDRKAHKRHENSTHYCPGISRAQIQSEGIELRKRFREYGCLLPLRLVIRERRWFLNIIGVMDEQQALVAKAYELVSERKAYDTP